MATAPPTKLHDAATIFVVRNILDSVAHYRDVLGFKVAGNFLCFGMEPRKK